MNTETKKMKFKKGDAITIIRSWNDAGAVCVRHYTVASWGKKQGTLLRQDDGSNAEFRVYTERASTLQGIHSKHVMATSDYSDTLALQIAEEFIADEKTRASARMARAESSPGQPYLDFERRLYADHNSTAWKAEVLRK
jgi:hypothetical protein